MQFHTLSCNLTPAFPHAFTLFCMHSLFLELNTPLSCTSSPSHTLPFFLALLHPILHCHAFPHNLNLTLSCPCTCFLTGISSFPPCSFLHTTHSPPSPSPPSYSLLSSLFSLLSHFYFNYFPLVSYPLVFLPLCLNNFLLHSLCSVPFIVSPTSSLSPSLPFSDVCTHSSSHTIMPFAYLHSVLCPHAHPFLCLLFLGGVFSYSFLRVLLEALSISACPLTPSSCSLTFSPTCICALPHITMHFVCSFPFSQPPSLSCALKPLLTPSHPFWQPQFLRPHPLSWQLATFHLFYLLLSYMVFFPCCSLTLSLLFFLPYSLPFFPTHFLWMMACSSQSPLLFSCPCSLSYAWSLCHTLTFLPATLCLFSLMPLYLLSFSCHLSSQYSLSCAILFFHKQFLVCTFPCMHMLSLACTRSLSHMLKH